MNVAAILIDKKVMKPADWVDGDVTREQVRSCNMYKSEQARDCTVDVLEIYYTIIIWYYDTNILSYTILISVYIKRYVSLSLLSVTVSAL